MTRKPFKRGDVVWLNLNPTQGKELQGESRPVLVVTTADFNALGTALVVPITQGGIAARFAGFCVTLMGTGMKTQGVAVVNMIRSVDLVARGAKSIEKAPAVVVDEVLAKLQAIFE